MKFAYIVFVSQTKYSLNISSSLKLLKIKTLPPVFMVPYETPDIPIKF